MERATLLHIVLGLLVVTPVVLSELNIDVNYDEDLKEQLSKRFDYKGTIDINCTVSGSDAGDALTVKWEKNGEAVDTRAVPTKDKLTYNLKITKALEEDAGNYTCIVLGKDEQEVKRASIAMVGKIHVKVQANLNFVEGEMIKIICQVAGKPPPTLSWRVGNETYEESRDRVTLDTDPDSKVERSIFIIKEAQMSDRGTYQCIAVSDLGAETMSESMVRVKDKYAALWPFLGICAEVFVLCAIILIYEKKRNKTELEESDTDQSPDQKNTPDHGKDSNLRHRN